MKKTKIVFMVGLILLSLLLVSCAQKTDTISAQQTDTTPIRIGWLVSWATQGQLAQTLKHTDILEKNGLQGEFKSFSYGGPLAEAAVSGEVDVIFTADLPSYLVLSKSDEWDIVARLIRTKAGIIVPIYSEIKSLRDLEGKTLSIPFGSGAHVHALRLLEKEGLKDKITLKNLDILEQSAIIDSGKWGDIDAFVSFDPTISIFQEKEKVRMLESVQPQSFVTMSKKFITEHPDAAKNFLKSYREAYFYYAQHQDEANTWYAKEARIKFDPSILDISASLEPNLKAQTLDDINIDIPQEDVEQMKQVISSAKAMGLIQKDIAIEEHINRKLLDSIK